MSMQSAASRGWRTDVEFDIRVDESSLISRLVAEIAEGLSRDEPVLPTRVLYMGQGGSLFDKVSRDPAYTLDREERALLELEAQTVCDVLNPEHIVELGGGMSDKLMFLIRASASTLRFVTAMDFDRASLERFVMARRTGLAHVEFDAIIGDLEHNLEPIPRRGRRLIAFLGSTLGNFSREARQRILCAMRSSSEMGDGVLIGVDLNRSAKAQIATYTSTAVARFNINSIGESRELLGMPRARCDVQHRAIWNDVESAIHVQLVPEHDIDFVAGETSITVTAGCPITTAISTKFATECLEKELADAGFDRASWWTNPDHTYGLVLAQV